MVDYVSVAVQSVCISQVHNYRITYCRWNIVLGVNYSVNYCLYHLMCHCTFFSLPRILTPTAKCDDLGVVSRDSVQTRIRSCESNQISPIPQLYFFTGDVLYSQFPVNMQSQL